MTSNRLQVRAEILRDHGEVWDMAGLRNFGGQGWRHSWILKLLGLDLSGSTFVSKTTTTDPRPGNTPLRQDYMTKHFKPPSVVIKLWGGHTLNAWGLSGPGAAVVLDDLAQCAERGQFKVLQISYMPVGDKRDDLLRQTEEFTMLLLNRFVYFRDVKFLIQFNASCPNTGHDLGEFLRLLGEHLNILDELGVPIVVKESVDTPFEPMRELLDHPACDGLVTTNSVKFGNLPEWIPWKAIFGKESPLKQFGGGGYSGPYLLPLVLERVAKYRATGYHGLIAAGGGVRHPNDVDRLFDAGADVICIGSSLANFRPWNSRAVIRRAKNRGLIGAI